MASSPPPQQEDHVPTTNNAPGSMSPRSPDDPQEQMISSLRSQINDLFQQVTQLNSKLVQSYDRVSDLEDNLHVTSSNLRSQTLKISQLELERSQHLSALDTGLLVEKDHVTTELTRLMERVSEEAVQRGKAETARAQIEKELDDLSANLFQQANTMVAEARWSKTLSERKVVDTENALKTAEEAINVMQSHMQELSEERLAADKELTKYKALMGKGKWVDRGQDGTNNVSIRLSNTHAPYQEFIGFIMHLRSLRTTNPQPPAVSTLLPLPFLTRLLTEDSDTTLRLDLAPSLNWLTRRSVQSAIHAGQLVIEPVMASHLLLDLSHSLVNAPAAPHDLPCAMCGKPVFGLAKHDAPDTPTSSSATQIASWASTRFLKSQLSVSSSATPSRPTTPPAIPNHGQVFVFRLYLPPPQKPTTTYPLCQHGWCLTRLRATCELWQFVRTSLIEQVWAEAPPPQMAASEAAKEKDKPPLPPRRRVTTQMGKIWGMGMGLGALGMEKVGSLAGNPQRHSTESKPQPAASVAETKSSPLAPPPPLPARSTGRSRGPSPTPPSGKLTPAELPSVPTTNGVKSDESPAPVSPPLAPADTPASPPKQSIGLPIDGEDIPADEGPTTLFAIPDSPEKKRESLTQPVPVPGDETGEDKVADVFSSPKVVPSSPPQRSGRRPVSAAIAAGFPLPDSPSNSRPGSPMKVVSPVPGTPPVLPRRAPGRSLRPVPPPPASGAAPAPAADAATETKVEEVKHTSDILPPPTHPDHTEKPADTTQATKSPELPARTVATTDKVDPPPRHPATAPSSNNNAVTESSSAAEPEPEPEPPARTPSPPPLPHRSSPVQEPSLILEAQPEDPTIVSDKTWEERAWKDLVRHREDLFWARVGGFR